MVILVCGLITEEPIKLLIEALDDLGAEYHLIELEALCAKVSLRWQLCDQGISGHLKIDGDVLDIQGLYLEYQERHRLSLNARLSPGHIIAIVEKP